MAGRRRREFGEIKEEQLAGAAHFLSAKALALENFLKKINKNELTLVTGIECVLSETLELEN